MIRKTEQGSKVSLFDEKKRRWFRMRVSPISPETGLSGDLERTLRKSPFWGCSIFSSERDGECSVLSSDKRNLRND